ncbi:MAG: cyclase family protein, partial [Tardiphaga sp.]
MDSNGLMQFAGAVASGAVRVVDLTFTLSPDFPVIVLPPEFGQAAPVRIQQISRYDASGPAWYWNNLTFGEH